MDAIKNFQKQETLLLQENRNGGRIVGKDVKNLLIEKYDVEYSLSSIYVLLDRLNLSWISSRSKHPKTSTEAIESFKENFVDIAEEIKAKVETNSKCVEQDYHAIILLDRAGWHMTEQMQMPANISFVPLPPYSPELNSMEQLWQQLRKLKLSNIAYKNHKEIEDACCEA